MIQQFCLILEVFCRFCIGRKPLVDVLIIIGPQQLENSHRLLKVGVDFFREIAFAPFNKF
jgi:hypothetical protein